MEEVFCNYTQEDIAPTMGTVSGLSYGDISNWKKLVDVCKKLDSAPASSNHRRHKTIHRHLQPSPATIICLQVQCMRRSSQKKKKKTSPMGRRSMFGCFKLS